MALRVVNTGAAALDVMSQAWAVAPDVEHVDTGALTRCLAGLDERSRTVVLLSFNDGKSAQVIAEAVASTAGNVRVLRHRAVMQLRSCLDDCKVAAR